MLIKCNTEFSLGNGVQNCIKRDAVKSRSVRWLLPLELQNTTEAIKHHSTNLIV